MLAAAQAYVKAMATGGPSRPQAASPNRGGPSSPLVGDGPPAVEERWVSPVVGLVERLRDRVKELQEGEALGEELQAEQRKLHLAETALTLLKPPDHEVQPAPGEEEESGGVNLGEKTGAAQSAAQASEAGGVE
jgi:hypothetical protein